MFAAEGALFLVAWSENINCNLIHVLINHFEFQTKIHRKTTGYK